MNLREEKLSKISFELEQDDSGYPPDKWETLWAFELAQGLYRVDNIPSYVYGISSGDVISAEDNGWRLVFEKLVTPSQNTVFRLYVADSDQMREIRENTRALGCESELSNLPKLVAVQVPGSVSFASVAALLEQGEESRRWRSDEGVSVISKTRSEACRSNDRRPGFDHALPRPPASLLRFAHPFI